MLCWCFDRLLLRFEYFALVFWSVDKSVCSLRSHQHRVSWHFYGWKTIERKQHQHQDDVQTVYLGVVCLYRHKIWHWHISSLSLAVRLLNLFIPFRFISFYFITRAHQHTHTHKHHFLIILRLSTSNVSSKPTKWTNERTCAFILWCAMKVEEKSHNLMEAHFFLPVRLLGFVDSPKIITNHFECVHVQIDRFGEVIRTTFERWWLYSE